MLDCEWLKVCTVQRPGQVRDAPLLGIFAVMQDVCMLVSGQALATKIRRSDLVRGQCAGRGCSQLLGGQLRQLRAHQLGPYHRQQRPVQTASGANVGGQQSNAFMTPSQRRAEQRPVSGLRHSCSSHERPTSAVEPGMPG